MPDLRTPPAAGRTPAATVAPVQPEPPRRAGIPLWFKGLAPLVLLAGLVFGFLRLGPVGVFRAAFPPVEELTLERVRLPEPGVMEVSVVNGGPEAVTIAQVMVDDANWVHTVSGTRTVERLERRTVRIPYPWVEGEPHTVTIVTNTGLTFSTEVPVATQSPPVDARYLGTFALLGVYAGVIPVFIGLLWLPFVRAIDRKWLDFFLSLTIGLLLFLGVDALEEALETSAFVPGAFQGKALVVLGLLGTPLVIGAVGEWRSGTRGERSPVWVAALIAFGIGLHNLGEGLAIGSSYATGEIALGTFLVIGFLLHNTTEGLGIVTPLADGRPRLLTLVLLGALAGVPTVIGAWIGGFTYSPIWTTLFFAVGAGAIVLVVYELWRLFARRSPAGLLAPLNAAGVLAGMLVMYVTGLLVTA
ncbi:MAG TPA: ZIP family metal transporter [Gemmatimonadales bacterium]|nr:ZIP family metal transporter [Gemmatimonadales bacterium]